MSFEKPSAILGHDPIFLAIFIVGAIVLLLVQKRLKTQFATFSIYILFFALLVVYILIRRIYE